jgi:hypothetical protein
MFAGTIIAAAASAVSTHLLRIEPEDSRGLAETRRLVDQQPTAEDPLERLIVAIALDTPARQHQIAGGLEVQVDALAIAA